MNFKPIRCDGERIPLVIPESILVCAAHPDDELISTGGTILKYGALGSKITIMLATQGLGGYAKEEDKQAIGDKRQVEFERTAEMLHCDTVELAMDEMEVNRQTVTKLTQLIREQNPQVILMPHFTDIHRTHRHLAEAMREAIYHASRGSAYGGDGKAFTPYGIYCYESPSCQFQYSAGKVFVIVDISNQWGQKRQIFDEVYTSQQEVIYHIMEWAEKVALLHGNEIQATFGEAFIPLTDCVPLRILLV